MPRRQDLKGYIMSTWNTGQKSGKKAAIKIEGDEEAERGMLFSIFHLIQSLPQDDNISLTARGIHGFGYRGHVFWDTEIYALPFFIFTMPEDARRMLVYRYNNLDAARENARLNGYGGAQFPWESADDGREATPPMVPLDMRGENVVRIYTGEEEHHITADIAYTVDLYYRITGDEEFMEKYGLEMIFETARFWASRVRYDEEKGYVIERVIGPDEYHEHVNNSFFTNLMAKHNLQLGVKYFRESLERRAWRAVAEKLGIDEDEVQKWFDTAERIYLPPQVNGVYEEFDGYFDLTDYRVDPGDLGEARLPEDIRNNIGRTRLIKQADVIAAQFLLKDLFTLDTIRRNFDYYIIRTTHASSLSMPAYAIVASWLGEEALAYDYFIKCAYADLRNIYGNTQDGFHLATAGGVWQVLVRGFCGIDIEGDSLKIEPHLPVKWSSVTLRLFFRGAWLQLKVGHKEVVVEMLEGRVPVRIRAFGKVGILKPGNMVRLAP
ncbi:glycosyl hydrolase family 65 protein [Palaeococcus ferrophilus]|uniref:glycosyl hydrolase family 65 protein n=1 Tax=Palaeococcus ferrophilus TaxID=83868 RepID=UPI001FE129DC|nr:glycosyl hydrolase family 65 protein [Palaeococcus ferrophilus]